jgi:hypothetical protein
MPVVVMDFDYFHRIYCQAPSTITATCADFKFCKKPAMSLSRSCLQAAGEHLHDAGILLSQ